MNIQSLKKEITKRLAIPQPVSIRYLMNKYHLSHEAAKNILIELNIPYDYSVFLKNIIFRTHEQS